MTTLTFDALQFVQRLKKAGIKEVEAETIAEAVRDVHVSLEEKITESSARLATKQDLLITEAKIKETEARLEGKIAETKAGLEARIAETKVEIEKTKSDLVRWVVSVGVLQTAIIGALVMKLIPG
jgi:hypothetical protein